MTVSVAGARWGDWPLTVRHQRQAVSGALCPEPATESVVDDKLAQLSAIDHQLTVTFVGNRLLHAVRSYSSNVHGNW
jgi:hypothetical protein